MLHDEARSSSHLNSVVHLSSKFVALSELLLKFLDFSILLDHRLDALVRQLFQSKAKDISVPLHRTQFLDIAVSCCAGALAKCANFALETYAFLFQALNPGLKLHTIGPMLLFMRCKPLCANRLGVIVGKLKALHLCLDCLHLCIYSNVFCSHLAHLVFKHLSDPCLHTRFPRPLL